MVFAVWVGDHSVLSIWSRAAPSSWVATQTERVGDPNGVIRDPTKNKKIKKTIQKYNKQTKNTTKNLLRFLCKSRATDFESETHKKNTHKKKEKTLKQTTHTDHSRFRLGRDPSFPSEFSRQRFTVGVIPLVVSRQRFPVRVFPFGSRPRRNVSGLGYSLSGFA